MSSHYLIKLNHFEGPLDLLIHLIRINELDVFEVDLVDLTQQYLDYLRLINFSDLTDASLFLAMAASLCEIKTRRLLPQDKSQKNGDDQDDLHENLRQRLLDYQQFKEAGQSLADRVSSSANCYPAQHEWRRLEDLFADSLQPFKGDTAVLLVLYDQMFSTLTERQPATVEATKEQISVETIIDRLKEKLTGKQFLSVPSLYSELNTRYELVAHFLGVLELVKEVENLHCFQDELFSDLWVYKEQKSGTLPMFN